MLMADKLQMASEMMDDFIKPTVKELVQKKSWMNDVSFTLVTKRQDLEALVDRLIEAGICALDLETTSLNTRIGPDGKSIAKLVGICLAPNPDEGFYVPVGHRDKEYNIPEQFAVRELKRLTTNCKCIYHNFKYDGQVLYNYGINQTDLTLIEDTFLMAGIQDASRRERGLKQLSDSLLGREMIEIDELTSGGSKSRKKVIAFDLVPPPVAVYYGGGDAMNTFGLYRYFTEKLDEQDPQHNAGPWRVYEQIEKPCLLPTMEMERNMTLIDLEFLTEERAKVMKRMAEIIEEVYELAGRKFDIASPKQLGTVLFEELKIKYPEREKTASGQYQTSEGTLSKIKDEAPIVRLILDYRSYQKTLGTYIENWMKNCDEKGQAKFQLNQLRADTGRYSASGGKGLNVDGYCGVNCQNIPTYDSKDPTSIDLRRAVVARPGYKIVTIDYSGEELRIAANFSHEPKWLDEFTQGSGDLHLITARIIHSNPRLTAEDKKERSLGKTLNFLTMYGGGAGGFAAQAKIPYETAKKMIINFFREYKGLNSWITKEIKRCKHRGYSRTAFGRRRPLGEFYKSTDKAIQAKGDRCAINSEIQGTGADIIKIALYRVWKWIHDNGFEDDVHILMPVHDEIVFEIKEDKLDFYIPELCEIMVLKDIVEKLKWPVPLTVDAEYGDSFHVTNDYYKEREEDAPNASLQSTDSKPAEDKQESLPISDTDSNTDSVHTEPMPPAPEGLQNEGTSEESRYYHFDVTVRDAMYPEDVSREHAEKALKVTEQQNEIDPALKDVRIRDRIDHRGVFIYPLERMDPVTVQQLTIVLKILTAHGTDQFIGPSCKVCFTNTQGEVWYETPQKVSIDALVALCLWLKI
ncbi:MAG: hypothetical protein GF334_05130 [Candidatus Altiarchaeales archaeon]|nr:hypothetical protein [Candidatus Altiarchaeales archaeon]